MDILSIKRNSQKILFSLILLLGIFVRAWKLGVIPSGLNQDEASSAVDAYYLVHYGMDRNGITYPVQFIMWGSGQSSLYEYLLTPFVAFDLTPLTARLPMFIAGLLALPLIYLVAKHMAGNRFALIAMFLLAISPWHIMSSRWGLADNMLPVIFMAGFYCLFKSTRTNYWFLASGVFFAVCFYAYGAAYVAVPVFLLMATPLLFRSGRVSLKSILWGITILIFLSIPIGLFLLVNSLKLESIHIGLLTIPRFPVQARYHSMSILFSDNRVEILTFNLLVMLKVLILQTDDLIWNSLQPYGYFYKITFPLEIIGVVLLITWQQKTKLPERLLLLAWLTASLVIGSQITININRINLIFIPFILCTALLLEWLAERFKFIFAISVCAFLVGFVLFTRDYFSTKYQEQIGKEFFAGFLPAVDFAIKAGNNPICVTDKVNMPYIYILFTERTNPLYYLDTVEYIDPNSEFRHVRSFGRYTFGLQNCPDNRNTIYILSSDEQPLFMKTDYKVRRFNKYNVYVPF